jgi:hypothetical protein
VTESPTIEKPTDSTSPSTEIRTVRGVNWSDPNVPAGNAPSLPRWPLVLSVAIFFLWVIFLIAMAVIRVNTTGH